jgi:hypothetical protein
LLKNDTSIAFISKLTTAEWRDAQNAAINCSELRRCWKACTNKCVIAQLIALFKNKSDKRAVINFLNSLEDRERYELKIRPSLCLDQGFCTLYCATTCPFGDLLRLISKD